MKSLSNNLANSVKSFEILHAKNVNILHEPKAQTLDCNALKKLKAKVLLGSKIVLDIKRQLAEYNAL